VREQHLQKKDLNHRGTEGTEGTEKKISREDFRRWGNKTGKKSTEKLGTEKYGKLFFCPFIFLSIRLPQ
jgi:hypothetical protein